MYTKSLALVAIAMASAANAHMHLYWPPALKGDNNPYTEGEADQYANYPYGCCGRANPGVCKGHLGLLDTSEGKSVTTWTQGQTANFSLSGSTPNPAVPGGNHYGGSCQASISVDKGKTFKVVSSWNGNCPLRNGGIDPSNQVFHFTVPSDVPTGDAVFSWSWINREQEFNMGCASITIAGGDDATQPQPSSSAPAAAPSATGTTQYSLDNCSCKCPTQTYSTQCSCTCDNASTKRHLVERKALAMHKRALENAAKLNAPVRRTSTTAFNDLPDALFSIDIEGADCESVKTTAELQWPNPGPNVVASDGEYPLAKPSGSCQGGLVGAFAS